MNDYIVSLKKNIKSSDIDLAKEILKEMPGQTREVKHEILRVLALAPDKTALVLLDFMLQQKNQDPDITERLIQLVTDRAHLNFQFAVILYHSAGRDRIIQAAPLLRHILSNETQSEILTATIETIGREKIDPLIDDVAEFIYYDDQLLKAKAVRALERIGTEAALERLEQAADTEKCDQEILDAIDYLKLKDQNRVEKIPKQSARGKQTDVLLRQLASMDLNKRFEAFDAFSNMGTPITSILSPLLTSRDHDLVINCLKIFSRTLPLGITSRIFSLLNDKTTDSGIKFSAYQLLGNFPELDSAASLVKGSLESAAFVRMAAVRALDKNMTDFVAAEIKQKIESGTKTAVMLAETILDVEAKNMIDYLLGSDTFSYMASNYFNKKVASQILETYITALEKRKLKATVRKYRDIALEQTNKSDPRIAVVTPSETKSKIYTKLITSAGCLSEIYRNPQSAFEAILAQRPAAVITDLFLNDMTGLDFAMEIRELYSKKELPVVASSLQKELIKHLAEQDETYRAVDAVCEFPMKISQIKSWVKA